MSGYCQALPVPCARAQGPRSLPPVTKTPFLVLIASTACTTATTHQASVSPAAQARADSGRPSYTAADVHFVAGGIGPPPPAPHKGRGGPPPRARPAGGGPGAAPPGAPNPQNAVAARGG